MSATREAYELMAPVYDSFTAHHRYDIWCAALEQLALDAGLAGNRLLDVACGTGKSFLPFLDRYAVTACDLSPAMAAIAAGKADGRARVEVHDMRSLPRLGEFDLVTCLDDAVNYLGAEDLVAALASLRRNLAPGGIVVFDANTLLAYRSFFANASVVIASDDLVLVWDGRTPPDLPDGGAADAELLVLERGEDDWWSRTRIAHRQRHHSEAAIRAALAAAGLGWVAAYGMHLDGTVTEGFDELVNSKAVYVAREHAPDQGERR
jgi:SAM-dependent methyltransferase